ncbi:30S ribosomal protein S16 [Luteococcus peritonei]|uniref:Small ribosomal subunit protein bS16 n=1 Tax=Luteococcus peritonei TaxID=88874 RepID=A0ABW4RX53_9ACTN
MATKIRLKRLGKIRDPHYRIVVMDSRTKRDGRAIEEVGQYHPKNDPSIIKVDSERVQYWLGVGAQPTEAVVAILKRSGDWQKFSGDKTPEGVDVAPEKEEKLARFNAALAEADDAPKSEAISKKKAKADEAPADEAAAEEAPAERAEATEDPQADAATPAEEAGEKVDEVAPAEGA